MQDASSWSPVSLSRDLPGGLVVGTTLHGAELALWRDTSGDVHVWPDACPHRGMRLSFGFVRDDRLGCAYHGWQFAPDGSCRLLPAHPDMTPQPAMSVRPLRAVERGGLVWTTPAFETSPDRPPETSAAAVVPVRSVTIEAAYDVVLAGLCVGRPLGTDSVSARVTDWGAEITVPDGCLTVGVHVIGPQATGVHLVVDQGLGDRTGALAHWLAGIRDQLAGRTESVAELAVAR